MRRRNIECIIEFVGRERGLRERERRERGEFGVEVNADEVARFGVGFPGAKSDENDGVNGDKILFFVAGAKFAANVAADIVDDRISMSDIDATHTVAGHFGD